MGKGSKPRLLCLLSFLVLLAISDQVRGQGQGQGQGQGRSRPTLKIRNYEIQFGRWPLMEITNLKKTPKPQFKPAFIGGFMQSAAQANGHGVHPDTHKWPQNSKSKPPKKWRSPFNLFGKKKKKQQPHPQNNNNNPLPIVPPPPSHPMTVSNVEGSPPMVMHPLHPNAPPPLGPNGQQPIIIKVPATMVTPTLPPPPPTTTTSFPFTNHLGKAMAYAKFFYPNENQNYHHHGRNFNNNYHPINSFPPGPPPLFHHNRPHPNAPPPPPPLNFNRPPQPHPQEPKSSGSYFAPQFRPPPPHSFGPGPHPHPQMPVPMIPYLAFPTPPPKPQMVYTDLDSSQSQQSEQKTQASEGMSKMPTPPPSLLIGAPPPPGYSVMQGEQQLVTLKKPNMKFRLGATPTMEDLLHGADYKLKHSNPYNRRQDLPFPTEFQNELGRGRPDVGAMYTVSMVLSTPNISAPTNGTRNPYFRQGMQQLSHTPRSKTTPLFSQIQLVGRLFTDLLSSRPIPKEGEESYTYEYTYDDPFGSGSGRKMYTPPKVSPPLMAVHIQSFSIPEPTSQDSDVLESARMFGLNGDSVQFSGPSEVMNLVSTAEKAVKGRHLPLGELGTNRGEVSRNFETWVMGYLALARKMKDEAHGKGMSMAKGVFKQGQFKMRMPTGQEVPMEPKFFREGVALTSTGGVATFQR